MEIHGVDSLPIDVRRMIQFGVIKGFLRRVYSFPLWLDHPSLSPPPPDGERRPPNSRAHSNTRPNLDRNSSSVYSSVDGASSFGTGTNGSQGPTPLPQTPIDAPAPPQERTALPSGQGQPMTPQPSATFDRPTFPSSLPRMLDGKHHTDEICIRYGLPFKYLESVLRFVGGMDVDGHDAAGGASGDGQRRTATTTWYGSRVVMLYV